MIPYQGREGAMNARIIDASLQPTVHKFYDDDDDKHLDAPSKLTAW